MLADTLDRVVKADLAEGASLDEVAERSRPTPRVTIAVMRAANNGGGPRGRVGSVPDAVEALTPGGVRAVAGARDLRAA